MAIQVYIDGQIFDSASAKISVFDRGFLYGDSVYEVMRTSGGAPVDLEPHMDRLHRSATSLALELPPRDVLEDAIEQTLRASGNAESYIRVVVTRGGGELGLDIALADRACLIVIVRELILPNDDLYRDGVALALVTVERMSRRAVDPAVKSGNYLNNILALHEARRFGADEAIMCDAAGRVAEGSSSNVFMVSNSAVVTPPVEVGLLPGITRERVIELARANGLQVREAEIWPDELRDASEIFITSSIRGVMGACTLDGAQVGSGAPGPVTARIMELYNAYLSAPPQG